MDDKMVDGGQRIYAIFVKIISTLLMVWEIYNYIWNRLQKKILKCRDFIIEFERSNFTMGGLNPEFYIKK